MKKHTCPVCGFPELNEPPRSKSGGGSYEICPSCGFEFGVTDDDQGISYADWRARWQKSGMKWSSRGRKAPDEWNPGSQLKVVIAKPSTTKRPSRAGKKAR